MDYRAYFLSESGHIVTFEQIDAVNDEEAIQQAARLKDGRDIEIWHHDRKVTLFRASKAS
jgi:hypothetical protein